MKSKKRPAQNYTAGRKAKQQKTEKEEKGRKKKDKSAVKRASSAYIFFSKDFRLQMVEKNKKTGEPIPKVNEMAKLCGASWKLMTGEDKQPFEQLAAEDKKRYLEQVGRRK